MDIGKVMEALKNCEKVARAGWDKGTWLVMFGDNTVSLDGWPMLQLPSYIGKKVGDVIIPWSPSHEDLLAQDWEIIEGGV